MVENILPLQINNASVKKRGETIIGPLSLEISGLGLTAIMGPNGSGKTTLLRLMHGLERPRAGSKKWNTNEKTARTHQSFVFQTPIMLRRAAIDNITYPLKLKGMEHSVATITAEKWLDRIGLSAVASLNATLLSGGEKQKLALARALATEPQVLFLDEPTSNLDGSATKAIEAILNTAAKSGIKIIMTTHDTGQARRLAQEIVFLYRGQVHETEAAGSFFSKPATKEAKAFLQGEIVE